MLFWQLLLTGVNEGFNEVTVIVGGIHSLHFNPTEVTLIRSALYDFIKSFSEGFFPAHKGRDYSGDIGLPSLTEAFHWGVFLFPQVPSLMMDSQFSEFTPDITPIMLAAHTNNYEIIKLLVQRKVIDSPFL